MIKNALRGCAASAHFFIDIFYRFAKRLYLKVQKWYTKRQICICGVQEEQEYEMKSRIRF